MTSVLLKVTLDQAARGRTIVRADGEVDMGTAPLLRDGVDRALADDTLDAVVVDLRAVTFLASAGLAALTEAHSRAVGVGTEFVVVTTPGGSPERAIGITGLDQLFRVVTDLDQAMTPSA